MVLNNATVKIKPSDHYVKTNTAVQTGKKRACCTSTKRSIPWKICLLCPCNMKGASPKWTARLPVHHQQSP